MGTGGHLFTDGQGLRGQALPIGAAKVRPIAGVVLGGIGQCVGFGGEGRDVEQVNNSLLFALPYRTSQGDVEPAEVFVGRIYQVHTV